MTVYVDSMRAPFGRMLMCHMIADTEAELHAMADRIGVARRWYQGDHYDIAQSKRRLAVEAGAVEITLMQCGAMCFRRNVEGALGSPDDAVEWSRARFRESAANAKHPEAASHPSSNCP